MASMGEDRGYERPWILNMKKYDSTIGEVKSLKKPHISPGKMFFFWNMTESIFIYQIWVDTTEPLSHLYLQTGRQNYTLLNFKLS